MPYLKLTDLELKGKIVLYRGPFNVPINVEEGRVVDDYRIRRSVPSMRHVLRNGGVLVPFSYLARPEGFDERFKMDTIAKVTEEILREDGLDVVVRKLNGVVGDDVRKVVRAATSRDVIFLENTRFYQGEVQCDPKFSRQLASLADVFVYDAPNDMLRRYSSTFGVMEHLVSAMGFVMDEEITTLNKLIQPPPRSVMLLGGSKVVGKYETIESLVELYDKIVIGGKMANTFLKAQGLSIGGSEIEAEYLERASHLLRKYSGKILPPIDVVVADELYSNRHIVDISSGELIGTNFYIFDTGPKTNRRTESIIKSATGIIGWNGPFGVFEKGFNDGNYTNAQSISDMYDKATTVIFGGDTHAVVRMADGFKFTHILIGGGSSLEYLQGLGQVILPGLEGLQLSYQKYQRGGYGQKGHELVRRA